MDTFITWIDAAWEIHGLKVVMAAFFMFFQRAALLVTATTVSTLMGFANWKKYNSLWDSDDAFNRILTTVRTRDKKPTPKIKPCCGEGRFCQFKKSKWKTTNGKLLVYLYINRPILWVLQTDVRFFSSDKDCDIKSLKTASTQVRNWDTFKGLGAVSFVSSRIETASGWTRGVGRDLFGWRSVLVLTELAQLL